MYIEIGGKLITLLPFVYTVNDQTVLYVYGDYREDNCPFLKNTLIDCLVASRTRVWRTDINPISVNFCTPLFLHNRVPENDEITNYVVLRQGIDMLVEKAELGEIVNPGNIYYM